MKSQRTLAVIAIGALIILGFVGWWLTGSSDQPSGKGARRSDQQKLVDQRPLDTARRLAKLVSTPEEDPISKDTLRIADHEVDLAFAAALRDAQEHPLAETPQSKELRQRIRELEAQVKRDDADVKRLTREVSNPNNPHADDLQDDLEMAQAQFALHQEEITDTKEDLARSGGDSESVIRRMRDEHEATAHSAGDAASAAAAQSKLTRFHIPDSLFAQAGTWQQLRDKQRRLGRAQQQAGQKADDLKKRHDEMAGNLAQASAQPGQAPASAPAAPPAHVDPKAARAAALAQLQRQSEDRRHLNELNQRIQNEQQLASLYGEWSALIASRQQQTLHAILASLLWILVILLLVVLADGLVNRFYVQVSPDRRRQMTMRAVLRFTVQFLGVICILFVLLGPPSQLSTILALAGAGLTVALKDFIVAFFGWFVLMGKNGIRVGDWVEINGIGGEVVEVGLLRTVLLETGNWTDSGHPTGRKVAFVNNFAIEGHYFNFSTTGQWLWDELDVLIPAGQDPYALMESIQQIVQRETEANVRQAEEEWQRATRTYGVQAFSATPSISLRPTAVGLNVIVRYITHAHERFDVRARLYKAVVGLLHQPPVARESGAHAD